MNVAYNERRHGGESSLDQSLGNWVKLAGGLGLLNDYLKIKVIKSVCHRFSFSK